MKRTEAGIIIVAICSGATVPACSTMKSVFAVDQPQPRLAPIENPFFGYDPSDQQAENIVLRTKKGDRSVEVELPGSAASMTDFVIPVSPAFRDGKRGPASVGGEEGYLDDTYKERVPSMTDREITHQLSKANPETESRRAEVEGGLGVMASEDEIPEAETSYLAQLDRIKQLYKTARYEAALLEIDGMIRAYPTDPKLYAMRGTLLDRIGRTDLALKSWNQSIRLDPSNQALRRFIERKQQKRSLATP